MFTCMYTFKYHKCRNQRENPKRYARERKTQEKQETRGNRQSLSSVNRYDLYVSTGGLSREFGVRAYALF